MLYFSIQNCRGKIARGRSPKRRVRDDNFIVGLSSDYRRIVFILAEALEALITLRSSTSRLRGRRSIWWGWRVTLLAPRIGNDVSYVTLITHDIHFVWQAQYLVRLEGGFVCSAHWKWRFICDAAHWWDSFCVAGAVFGEGWSVTLLAPRIGNDVSYPKQITDDIDFVCHAQYLVRLEGDFPCSGRSPEREMLYFSIQNCRRDRTGKVSEAAGARWRFYPRLSSDYRRIVFISSEALEALSPEIFHFQITWQAQYLVRFEGDFTCSAHWKWRFICDADHWWHSFCVAGAVFGEVGGSLYLLRALEMTFHMWRRSLMTFILCGRRSIWWGWRVALLAARIGNDVSYVMRIIDDDSFCVAGAVFGEVGGWLCLLRALEMTFHMSRGSMMRFILRGRRNIWWSWRVTLVAPRIVNDVSCVTPINHEIHFAWQAQYLVKLDGVSCCSAHCKWRFKVVPE